MYTKEFWRASGIRVVRSFFLTLATLITTGSAMSDLNWLHILSASLVMAIYTFALCMAGIPEAEKKIPTDISPDLPEGAVIDTLEADAELEGNLISDTVERGEG